ncbi:MAG: TerB family tellurite resistance protein [Nitrospinota bacterium]|nr:TerB family tellurite resistance protein [Nitrospinota bacterium]
MALFKHLTFLKVLAVIAWADGEITESEKNVLKKFYRKFRLEKDDIRQLNPYLMAPIPKKEQEKLFKQLAAELSSEQEKEEIIAELETIANAHLKKKTEENELVEEFIRLLKKTSFTRRSFGRVRNFFQATIFKPAHERNPSINNYFKNTIFKKLELKMKGTGLKLDLEKDNVYFICLFGALLASVAAVDDHFHEEERKTLRKILKERFEFSGKEQKLLFEVVEEQAKHGFDFHEVVTEFNSRVTYNDRVSAVDCFWAIAVADGEISHAENEEVRRITKAMHVPHQVFKESKKKFLKQLKSS